MAISRKQRDELRMMFGGFCAYCGIQLPEKGWHADHVEPIYRDWICVANKPGPASERCRYPEKSDFVFPACAPCNILKGVLSLEQFRTVVSERVSSLRKYSGDFRHAERFGMIAVATKPIVFWFEKYIQQQAISA